MTSPGGREVGRVSVRAVPNASSFGTELLKDLERIEQNLRVRIPTELDPAGIMQDARRLAAMAEQDAQVQLRTLLDTSAIAAQVRAERDRAEQGPPVALPTELQPPPPIPQAALPKTKLPVADPIDAAFQARTRADLRRFAATLELNVPAGIEGEVLRRQVAAQIKAVEKGLAAEIPTRPGDAAEYRRRLRDQLRLIERTVDSTVPVKVDLQVPPEEKVRTAAEVDAAKKVLERNPVRIPLDVDTSQLTALARQITSLGGTLAGLGVGAVVGQAALGGVAALAVVPAVGAAAAAVVGTLKIGLSGLSDALTADTPKKYAEALAAISPRARELVQELRSLGPEVRRLRDSVQDRVLSGLSDEVQSLAEVYLPTLRRGLGAIADEINTGALDLARFAREGRTLSVLRTTLDDSAEATSLLTEALRPAAAGIRSLVDVGSDFLPGLAAKVTVLAERWSLMLRRSADDGRLREWISQALDSVGDLLGIVGNVGRAFSAVFRAGQSAGAGLLDTVRDITGEVADFANGTRGQQTLASFLSSARELALDLLPLLGSVVQLVGDQLAPLLSRVGATIVPALVRAVDSLGTALDIAAPGIEKFAGGIASLVTSLADGGAIDAVGDLAGTVGGALGDALTVVGPKLAQLVTAVGGELRGALPGVISGIGDVAGGLGDMFIAGSPLLDFLGRLVSEVGLPVLKRAAENLTPIIRDLSTWLTEGPIASKLPEVGSALVEFVDELGPLVEELVGTGRQLGEILLPHMDDIVGSMKDLAAAAQPVATGLTAVASAIAFVSKHIDDMTEKVPGLKFALGDKGLFGTIMSGTTPLGPLKGIYDAVAGLTKIMSGEYPEATRKFNDYTLSLGEGTRVSMEQITQAGRDGLLGLLGLVQENGPLIADFFMKNLFTMADGQRTVFGQMLADLTDHWGRMDAAIAERTFGISDKVNSAWERVRESTRREWEETERRVAEGIDDVAAETSTLPGRVRDSLGNISGVLYPNGASLIAGFIAGMKSQELAARRAAAAVMEIVSGAFPSSPARYGPFSGTGWTPYRGAKLISGFAEGMTSGISGAVQAAEQVAKAVAEQLPTGAAFPGTGVGSAPSVYAPIDARGTDPEKVAAIVPHRLLAALNTT